MWTHSMGKVCLSLYCTRISTTIEYGHWCKESISFSHSALQNRIITIENSLWVSVEATAIFFKDSSSTLQWGVRLAMLAFLCLPTSFLPFSLLRFLVCGPHLPTGSFSTFPFLLCLQPSWSPPYSLLLSVTWSCSAVNILLCVTCSFNKYNFIY